MNKYPTEWKKIKLGFLGEFSKGSGITKKDLLEDGVPCVRYAELYTKFDFIIPFCLSFISKDTAKTAKLIQKGDILFAGSGETKEEIGKCAVYMNDLNAYAGGDNIVFRTTKAVPLYLSFYLNTLGRRQLNKLGQGDSIVHIHSNNLKNVIIPLPPLPEQEKIAEILGTWDTAIEKLSALIEQKKLMKKGLMQKLLTGKQRLKGFSTPWHEVKLGELLVNISERNKELKISQVLSVTNSKGFILPEEQFSRNVASEDLSNYKIVQRGDFAYNPSRINVGSIDQLNNFENGLLSPMYVVFRCNRSLLDSYMKHFIRSLEFIEKINCSVQGSVRETVDFKTLTSIKIKLSSDLSEQKAIADILSKADEEITLLTDQLSALQSQKKGLMQKLLTGQIRVKVN